MIFELVRACAAVVPTTQPSHQPSASPAALPSLPVTGDDTSMIVGVGAGLVLAGAVLFFVIRRRRSVKFVA